MLRISKLADYAVVVACYLAQQENRPHSASCLSRELGIAAPTVRKICQLLQRADLLIAMRGSRGGYCLLREPHEISIANVVAAVDGRRELVDCLHDPERCSLQSRCQIMGRWHGVQQQVDKILQGITIASFCHTNVMKKEVSIDPRQLGVSR